MAQHAWNITGHQGNTYKLGLFHGDKTHHVVVHCNNRVIAIDFSVKESKTYSLFLDQELCELTIDHTGNDNYEYNCRINHDAATPLNEKRRQYREEEAKTERLRLIAAASVAAVMLVWLLGSML
jgi:tRNA A-37 threonylcarbamoyl transferase component Bud32